MKKFLLPLLLLVMVACSEKDDVMSTFPLSIKITGIEGVEEACTVELRDQQSNVFTAELDGNYSAQFELSAGIYEASLSVVQEDEYFKVVYNALKSGIVVGEQMEESIEIAAIKTVMQVASPILIKEVYVGGCQKDDGSGKFTYDKCIILYNNSNQAVSLANVGIGMVGPYNADASNYFLTDGALQYEQADWIPAINGIWYFDSAAEIAPYSQLVVAMTGAVDHTTSYKNSINYAKSDYYCMYDPEAASSDGGHYNNASYYPAPSDVIPTSHYLKAAKYGKGNAWPISNTSPGMFVFSTKDTAINEYANDESNIVYPEAYQGKITHACLKVPRTWILDAVELYNSEALAKSNKRLTSDIDNGYVAVKSGYGHSVIRKKDDAASAKVGHDVYMDTNNSSNDFVEADNCSIK